MQEPAFARLLLHRSLTNQLALIASAKGGPMHNVGLATPPLHRSSSWCLVENLFVHSDQACVAAHHLLDQVSPDGLPYRRL